MTTGAMTPSPQPQAVAAPSRSGTMSAAPATGTGNRMWTVTRGASEAAADGLGAEFSAAVSRRGSERSVWVNPLTPVDRSSERRTPVTPAVAESIAAARRDGSPLPSAIRLQMEDRLSSELSDVRIHDDAEAHALTAELGATAFTSGRDIFFASGAYTPGTARGEGLLAHELSHVVEQDGAEDTVQRSVGFEFETGWAVREIERRGRRGDRRKTLEKGTILHMYQGFNLTADEASRLPSGAELEWVVDPPVPESGRATLQATMNRMHHVASQIEALHARRSFTLDQATGDPRDAWIEVVPSENPLAGPNMPTNPQVTAGIRLDMMHTLYAELGIETENKNPLDPHSRAKDNLQYEAQKLLSSAAKAVDDHVNGSDQLKGLVVQLVTYLRAASLMHLNGNAQGAAFNYAKLIGKIMARTDFGAQFRLLPAHERALYQQAPAQFAALVLGAARIPEAPMDPNVPVYERGFRVDANDATKGTLRFPVTREDWLRGIAQGTDRLSSKHSPHWKSELEGLGALGDKMDRNVGRGGAEDGVIVEFRTGRKRVTLNQWVQFALENFDYIVDLNNRMSPQEQQAANIAALALSG